MSKENYLINFFQKYFNIQPQEFRLVQLFFLYNTLISLFYTASSAIAETLFLHHYKTLSLQSVLAWIYIGTAIASIFITLFYDRYVSKIPRIKFIIVSDFIFAFSIIIIRILISFPETQTWIYFLLVVWLEAVAIFKITLFFSCLGDYFSPSRARYVYGYITLGYAVGSILAGVLVDRLTSFMSVSNILYINASIFLCCIIVAKRIYNFAKPIQKTLPSKKESRPIRFLMLLKNHYLKIIFLIVLVTTIAYILSDYIMLIMASKTLKEEELAKFFAKFYGYVGLCELIIEVFLASLLLKRFGVMKVLFILPILTLITAISFVYNPILVLAVLIYFIFLSLYETLTLISSELLFLPLSIRLRISGQALAEGILGPVAKIVGGTILLLFAILHAPILSYAFLLIALALVWLTCLIIFLPKYKKKLVESIIKPNLLLKKFNANSVSFHKLMESGDMQPIVKDILCSGHETQQLLMLSFQTKDSFSLIKNEVNNLLQSNNEKIIKKAIWLYGKFGGVEALSIIKPFLHHVNTKIQSKAIYTYSRLAREKAFPIIKTFSNSKNLLIKFTALFACYKFGEDAQKAAVGQKIKELIQQNKSYGMKFLEKISTASFIPEINTALIDDDPYIRRNAVLAAIKNPDTNFISNLVQNLVTNSVELPLVLQALYKMPESSIKKLKTYLLDSSLPNHAYNILLRVIAKIGGEEGIEIILNSLVICSEQRNLASSYEALQLILPHRLNNKNILEKLHRCQNNFYQHILQGHQFLKALSGISESQKQLFIDIICFYTHIYFTLLGLEYGASELFHIFDSTYKKETIRQSDMLEILEAMLPRKIFIMSAPLISFNDQEETNEIYSATTNFINELMDKDIYLSSLIFFNKDTLILKKLIPNGYIKSQKQQQMTECISTISYLKEIELFSQIPVNYLLNIADIVHAESFCTDDKIVIEGEKGESLYFIISGKVLIHHNGNKIAELGPNECIGEFSIIDQLPRSATATALTEIRALRIDAEGFNFILSIYPEMAKRLLRILAQKLRKSI